MIPMYRVWLPGLYGLHGPRCPLSPNLITQTQTQTEFYSTSIEITSITSGCKNQHGGKPKNRLKAWHDKYACWETSIEVRPDRLHRGHPEESTWPRVLIILETIVTVHHSLTHWRKTVKQCGRHPIQIQQKKIRWDFHFASIQNIMTW